MTRTPDSWTCDIKYDGICETNATYGWVCPVEQVDISACGPCNRAWREAARVDAYLSMRCPRCAKIGRPSSSPRTAPKKMSDEPLTGIVARAVDNAMFAEGILIDARNRVLRRLATEAAWLGGWGEGSGADGSSDSLPDESAAEDAMGHPAPEADRSSGSLERSASILTGA